MVFPENFIKSTTAPSSHIVNRVFFCCLMMPKDMLQIALLFIISCMVEEVDGGTSTTRHQADMDGQQR